MGLYLRYLRASDGMKIRNTQLAAALMALGEKLLPSTNFNVSDVTFDFVSSPEIVTYEAQWRDMWAGRSPGDDPLSVMFKMSKARQWILEQVVHGNHNAGLALPTVTCEVADLQLAVWLVASEHYLLKLDKERRIFHFPIEAKVAIPGFSLHGRSYLKELDYLIRRIGGRNLARQKVAPVV